jgi:hypothetical protein
MRLHFGIGALLIAACAAPVAFGDVDTTYDITFTGPGTLPASGSFTYDSTNPSFSDFTVTYEGYLYDLTAEANAPTFSGTLPCVGSGAAATFALLSGACAPPLFSPEWIGENDPSANYFEFFEQTTEEIPSEISITDSESPVGGTDSPSNGEFIISDVPEPTSLVFLLTALIPVVFVARKRMLGV